MMLSFIYFICLAFLALLIVRWFLRRARRKNTIGIFHLYCSSGGGGERVLWHMVKILLDKYPNYTISIYTHKDIQNDSLGILLKARSLFQIDLISDGSALERLEFIPLSFSPLVEAKRYPFLTMFLQNLMSIFIAAQAAYKLAPEIYIESIGFAFTLPVFKLLFNSTVITYVHYPTISNDMINDVSTSSHASFNNREIFVKSPLLRRIKLIYYRLFAKCYGCAGRCADLVLVNSSWTKGHIDQLWNTQTFVVYPPCDTDSFSSLELNRFDRKETSTSIKIVSVAQFRPEKNHQLQIEAFDIFLNRTKNTQDSQLILFGGCRDSEDAKRVEYLKDLIHRLDLSSRVSLIINAPFERLLEGLRDSDVALHTMVNEHFGIVLLEFMSAGLITVAHNSGGPRTDIIDDKRNGFLCNDVDEFAKRLAYVSQMNFDDRQAMRANAIQKSQQFSVGAFENALVEQIDKYLT